MLAMLARHRGRESEAAVVNRQHDRESAATRHHDRRGQPSPLTRHRDLGYGLGLPPLHPSPTVCLHSSSYLRPPSTYLSSKLRRKSGEGSWRLEEWEIGEESRGYMGEEPGFGGQISRARSLRAGSGGDGDSGRRTVQRRRLASIGPGRTGPPRRLVRRRTGRRWARGGCFLQN